MTETEEMVKKSRTHTILIIEDDIDIQNFISRVLELEGHRTLRADNGQTGLDLMQNNTVSLVMLDLRLPGPDGWSILQEIRNNPRHSDVPVVVLTAIAESVQRRRTLRMGAVKYLVKPLSAHALSKTVADILDDTDDNLVAGKTVAVKK
jgi:two-component system response regulator AdeR